MSVPIRQDLRLRAWLFEVCMALSEVQAVLYDKLDTVMLTEPLYRYAAQAAIFIQFKPPSDLHALRQELRQVRPAMDELVRYFHLFATTEAKMDPEVMMGFHERFTVLLEKLDALQGEEH